MSNNNQWTSENIPDQSGRVAIVTGANSGIGYETARALAHKGATVIMACRSVEKGQVAAQKIQDEDPQGTVAVMALDLADLSSVRDFAEGFKREFQRLNLLINNAGVMMLPDYTKTADGFEMQFGTNHLGHFALTGLLLETISRTPGARVVMVSSTAERFGRMNFDNLNAEQSYDKQAAYGQSKLANLLFTAELQRRFEAAGLDTITIAAHPGWTTTNLQRHTRLRLLNPIFAQGPEMGALPTLYAATSPDVRGGDYFGPGGFMQMRGYPTKVKPTDRSKDEADAKKLWEVSEELTGITFNWPEREPASAQIM
jgi:NAD(P)-dependent dehydrogenase (short-subunit alcohol dehydrogenase family)